MGGQAATQVIQGEKLFDLVVRMKPEFRENAQQIGNLLVGTPAGQQIPLSAAGEHSRGQRRFVHLSRETIRATSACSTASKDATCRAPWTTGSALSRTFERSLPPGYRLDVGRRVQRIPGSAAADGDHRAARGAADFHDPVRALRQFQIPGDDCARRGDDRAGRRADRAEADAHAVQRFVRAGTAGADGRFGGDRGDSAFPTSTSCAWRVKTSARRPAKLRCCGCGPS